MIRARDVLSLHQQGLNYVEIAKKYNITRERVRQLHSIAVQLDAIQAVPPSDAFELSVRVHNALIYDGIEDVTPANVRAHFASLKQVRRTPGMGEKAIEELQSWLVRHGMEPIP